MEEKVKLAKLKKAHRFERHVTLLSGAGMFLDGFDISVIAVALPGLKKTLHISGSLLEGLVACSLIMGMFFGMMIGGRLADYFGRRRMYMIDLSGFVIFALLAAITTSAWQLIATRFLLGLFIGADYPISSAITAEFTSPKLRGKMIIFMSLLWQSGAFFAYIIGVIMLPLGQNAWRYMLLVGAILAGIVLLLRAEVPESPRWLRAHGRIDEANEIMAALSARDGHYFEPAADQGQLTRKTNWIELFSPNMIRATTFCALFWFAFAVSFYGIQMYTPSILKPFTQGSPALAYVGSAIIAALGVIGAGIGMLITERLGRRRQIILCFLGMSIVLSILALSTNPNLLMLTVLLSSAILLANMGPGVLNMVYPNELFPTRLRASGVGFAGAISRIGAILGVFVFPTLVKSFGISSATWMFAGVCMMGLIASLILAPETRGLTLEQLEERAEKGWKNK